MMWRGSLPAGHRTCELVNSSSQQAPAASLRTLLVLLLIRLLLGALPVVKLRLVSALALPLLLLLLLRRHRWLFDAHRLALLFKLAPHVAAEIFVAVLAAAALLLLLRLLRLLRCLGRTHGLTHPAGGWGGQWSGQWEWDDVHARVPLHFCRPTMHRCLHVQPHTTTGSTQGTPAAQRSLLQVHLHRRLLGQPLVVQGIVRRLDFQPGGRLGCLCILLLRLLAWKPGGHGMLGSEGMAGPGCRPILASRLSCRPAAAVQLFSATRFPPQRITHSSQLQPSRPHRRT